MDRPSLTTALTTVLSAAVDHTQRPALLARIHGTDRRQETGTQASAAPVPLPRSAAGAPTPARPVVPVQGRAQRTGSGVQEPDLGPAPAA